ncbi:hypothetical protein [uncultured Mediterranean phage uvMED]|nr:hypothetical protein [uncultured Mediterranean phage uvMED]
MNQNKVLNKVRVLLGLEVELESMKLEDGVTVLDAEVFEAGEAVFVMTEDDQKIPLPVGEYKLEDGQMLVVSEEGLIAEMKQDGEEEKEEEEAEVEAEVEAEAEETVAEEAKPVKKTVESVVKETFFSEIEALVNENKELKSQLEELSRTEEVKEEEEAVEEVVEEVKEEEAKEEAVELSSEEAGAEPLAHNPEASDKKEIYKFASKAKNNKLNSIFAKINK